MSEHSTQRLPASQQTQPEINGLARWACGLVSVAGFVAGGVATFQTDNEIGTSGLLLVGVFAGVVTLLQRIPKVKWGDAEVDPGEVLARGLVLGAEVAADAADVAVAEHKPSEEVAQAARAAITPDDAQAVLNFLSAFGASDVSREQRAWSNAAGINLLRNLAVHGYPPRPSRTSGRSPRSADEQQFWSEEKAADDTDGGD